MFIRRCAWHTKYHGYSKILGITWSGWGVEFSHGICSDCAARTRAEWRLPSASEPAVAPPAPRRPLRSLRPDFVLAAAVVLLAVTATFALVGVPRFESHTEQRSAAVDRKGIDETSPGVPPSSSTASPDGDSTAGGGAAPSPSAPAPSAGRPSVTTPTVTTPTPPARGTTQVAEAPPASAPSSGVSDGGRSSRSRVARVRGRGVVTGTGVVPVSAPEMCPCQGDQERQVVATTSGSHTPAAAPDLVARPSNFALHLLASRFNEVQAP